MSASNIYEISTIITQEQRFACILPDFLVNPGKNKFLENVLIMHKNFGKHNDNAKIKRFNVLIHATFNPKSFFQGTWHLKGRPQNT